MNFCLGVMNRHARRLAGTAAQPPTPDHEFTMCSPHGNRGPLLGRPAGSLCCTSYALARNLETVAWCMANILTTALALSPAAKRRIAPVP